MKNLTLFLGFLLFFSFNLINAQTAPPTNLNGEGLKDWLRSTYHNGKHVTLGYSTARSYMYGFIDNKNSTLTCVYSGDQISWAYGSSGTNPQPFNCEHTIPQSFFSSADPMVSDLHHLYPTNSSWNSTRGNYPLTDIDDSQTTKWMYLDQSQTTIPTSNIDAYSEYYTLTFEPREDHKGNAARSIFYFYTMYPNEAGSITQSGDPAVLYQWSENDPINTDELQRNNDIEFYQGDRNPFVDYPNAIADAWGFNLNSNAPSMPSNFTVSSSTTNINLSWSDTSNETGYYLYRSSDNLSYTLLSTLSSNTSSYTDHAVTANTTYYYYLTPYNASGTGVSTMIDNGTASSNGGGGGSAAADLFISEYIEGSSYNKGIELANATGANIDLSQYDLRKQTNGAGSWSSPLTLSGNLADGSVYVAVHSSSAAGMLAVANLTSSNSFFSFNGNDALGLFKNGALIDIVGTFDGGSANFGKNTTLVRKSTVSDPSTTYSAADWDAYSSDTFTDLGSHTLDGTAATPTCEMPTGLASSAIETDAATLSWTATTDAIDYTLQYRETGSSTWSSQTTTSTNVSLSGLNPSTTYEAQIGATCSEIASTFSSTITFTTDDLPVGSSDLFISEYIEGSSYNKGLEIANLTGSSVDLSQYDLRKQTNGSGNWTSPLTLSGSLSNGDVFVVVHSSASSTMKAVADLVTNSNMSFNGNDPMGLFHNGVLIDIVGTFNGGSTNFAANTTLVRKSTVTEPNTSYTTSEWDTYSSNTFTYLGNYNGSGARIMNTVFEEKVSIFPNPSNGVIYINMTTNKAVEGSIRVIDVLGKIVTEQALSIPKGQSQQNINLNHLSKGLYYITIEGIQGQQTQKVILD